MTAGALYLAYWLIWAPGDPVSSIFITDATDDGEPELLIEGQNPHGHLMGRRLPSPSTGRTVMRSTPSISMDPSPRLSRGLRAGLVPRWVRLSRSWSRTKTTLR